VGLGAAFFVAALAVPLGWLPVAPLARHLVRAIGVVLAGYLLGRGFEYGLRHLRPMRDHQRAGLLRLIVRLCLYVVVVAGLLAALGVRATQLSIGGAVLTVVLGLAGQTLFGNVLAGVVLVLWRPFEIGEHVSIVSWQMPVLASTFPHETLPSANPLRIVDINPLHTLGVGEDGQLLLIPNSVMLQAIVHNHSRSERQRVRVRAEARGVSADELLAELEALCARIPHEEPTLREVRPLLVDAGPEATAFVLEGWVARGGDVEAARSRLVLHMARIVQGQGDPPTQPPSG